MRREDMLTEPADRTELLKNTIVVAGIENVAATKSGAMLIGLRLAARFAATKAGRSLHRRIP